MCKTRAASVFAHGPLRNPVTLFGVAVSLATILVVTYVPFLQVRPGLVLSIWTDLDCCGLDCCALRCSWTALGPLLSFGALHKLVFESVLHGMCCMFLLTPSIANQPPNRQPTAKPPTTATTRSPSSRPRASAASAGCRSSALPASSSPTRSSPSARSAPTRAAGGRARCSGSAVLHCSAVAWTVQRKGPRLRGAPAGGGGGGGGCPGALSRRRRQRGAGRRSCASARAVVSFFCCLC